MSEVEVKDRDEEWKAGMEDLKHAMGRMLSSGTIDELTDALAELLPNGTVYTTGEIGYSDYVATLPDDGLAQSLYYLAERVKYIEEASSRASLDDGGFTTILRLLHDAHRWTGSNNVAERLLAARNALLGFDPKAEER